MSERTGKQKLASRKPAAKATKAKVGATAEPASRQTGRPGRDPGGWREEALARVRALILEADPAMTEERKWKKPSNGMAGVPVWSNHGIVCTGETYKQVVKLTFAKGASLPDPSHLFNAGLEGNARRVIDIREGEEVDATAFQALIRAAVAANLRSCAPKSASPPKPGAARPVKLLSGGNPQIAKADGDAPVQAYIAAMPGWKRDLGERLDAIIAGAVPGVRKAVKWNSPFYGVEGRGWFLSFHCFTKYVKVAFFRGMSLKPVPPGASKDKNTRYLDIREGDALDESQMAAWVKQAAALPGWVP
ncbi:MAG TPA: DUF1801 domain-containing protein [Gemmataceae bacterium]|nr:DUF1801 domain-containing protein [Gemmataceae bacterium]